MFFMSGKYSKLAYGKQMLPFSIVQVTSKLTFNTISAANAGTYWCSGRSDVANITITTDPATISVSRELLLPVTIVEILCYQPVVLLSLLVVLVNNSVSVMVKGDCVL